MVTANKDLTHCYSSWCFAQPTEEIIGSRSVSVVGALELGRPWHRNHWQMKVAEWFHIGVLDLRLAVESCYSTYVMTTEFHTACLVAEPADFGPCTGLCS